MTDKDLIWASLENVVTEIKKLSLKNDCLNHGLYWKTI